MRKVNPCDYRIKDENKGDKGFISYVVILILTSLLFILSLTFSVVLINRSTVHDEEVLTAARYACEKGIAWSLACIYENSDCHSKLPERGETLVIEDNETWTVLVVGDSQNTLLIRSIHKRSGLSAQAHITYEFNSNNGQIRVNSIKDY